MLSSGDNFCRARVQRLAREWPPFYDSLVVNAIDYDALAIGNHEFDFGPEVLVNFIEGVDADTPFLSANLDLAGEPRRRRWPMPAGSPAASCSSGPARRSP